MTSSIKIVVFFGASCTISVSSKAKKLKNVPEKKEGLHYLHGRKKKKKIVSVPKNTMYQENLESLVTVFITYFLRIIS